MEVAIRIDPASLARVSTVRVSRTGRFRRTQEAMTRIGLAFALDNMIALPLQCDADDCLARIQVMSSSAVSCALAIKSALLFLGVAAELVSPLAGFHEVSAHDRTQS
ncbi:hypothetical protein AB4Z48_33875 [Cupriavidus sp. 2TAF22]|uniref:hypothetical protein n=1 Tax=unclassified Cupriavidus TaxID=2640874 RepID=UPI003F8DD450